MADRDDSYTADLGGELHQRWFAMKSAYAEYARASEALEAGGREPDLWDDRRDAFERYLEARIAFVETQVDEQNRPGSRTTSTMRQSRARFLNLTWVSGAFLLGLLVVMGFS